MSDILVSRLIILLNFDKSLFKQISFGTRGFYTGDLICNLK